MVFFIPGVLTSTLNKLDQEVTHWRSQMFANSTKSTYSVHLRAFLKFCQLHSLNAVPASTLTITRYAAFLARTKTYGTVTQYMNIIRIIHVEFGLHNPLQNNW